MRVRTNSLSNVVIDVADDTFEAEFTSMKCHAENTQLMKALTEKHVN